VFWSLLNPLLMTIVYASVFGAGFAKYYHGSIEEYVVNVFIGLVVLNFFVGATETALTSIVANATLLNKLRISFEAFPLAAVASYGAQLTLGAAPFLMVLTLGCSQRPEHLLLLPIPLASLALLSAGIGFVLAALYVHYRDIPYMYEMVAFLIWITSPVFYPIAIAPERIQGVLKLNPLFPMLQSLREVVLEPVISDPYLLFLAPLAGAGVCAAGFIVFRVMKPTFMDML
jgi:ABC-2 type transport system permease protein/lipopolysaccharide transport system permease protein